MIAPGAGRALLGHERLERALTAAARRERLPHAVLFCGPEGVGKRTLAVRLARELVSAGDPEEMRRFDLGIHDRFLLFQDLEKPLPVRRGDLLGPDLDEENLLGIYRDLESESWITGVARTRGAGVIDLLVRNLEKLTTRQGAPLAGVLERELAALARSERATPEHLATARRLFSIGTSVAPFRKSIGIELVNGKGDGRHSRNVSALLGTSSRSGWRVVVLDDAHKMTDACENAFLKTLEEPPPNTLLILVTSEPLSLLPTTLSRCVRFAFDAVPAAEIRRFLVETQGIPEEEAGVCAALAEGSVGRALEIAALDFRRGRELLEQILPAIAAGDLGRVLRLVGRRLAATDRDRDAERAEARFLLELLALSFHDFVLARLVPDARPATGLERAKALQFAARRPIEVWERLFGRTEVALEDLRASVEPRLAVEALFAEALPARE
jgi:DNA polymerase III delta prime subunit